MRALLWAVFAVVFFTVPGTSQEAHRPHHPWLRRITLAGACAASFWDFQTTRIAVSQGARETNPLFADSQGRPNWGRIVGFKAGVCAASFLTEEHFARRGASDTFWTSINGLSAGSFAAIAIRNWKIASEPAAPPKPQ